MRGRYYSPVTITSFGFLHNPPPSAHVLLDLSTAEVR
jgi:hypothetical protein